MISEVHNCDCIEFMRDLPNDFFDLAICDPPYSHCGSDVIIKGGRFHKGRFNRYRKVDGSPIDIDAWDKTPPQAFFDEIFRVSKNQIIWGGKLLRLYACNKVLYRLEETNSRKLFNGNVRIRLDFVPRKR